MCQCVPETKASVVLSLTRPNLRRKFQYGENMERQIKQLGIKGNSYTLHSTQYLDGWECRLFQNDKEVIQRIRKVASEHDVRFLAVQIDLVLLSRPSKHFVPSLGLRI